MIDMIDTPMAYYYSPDLKMFPYIVINTVDLAEIFDLSIIGDFGVFVIGGVDPNVAKEMIEVIANHIASINEPVIVSDPPI